MVLLDVRDEPLHVDARVHFEELGAVEVRDVPRACGPLKRRTAPREEIEAANSFLQIVTCVRCHPSGYAA